MAQVNNFPKLHNAAWPGVVGKGSPGAEPIIDLDTMLDLTAKAEVNGARFDGVDLFLFAPHVDIDSSDDDLKRLADKVRRRNLAIGSVVAPVWPGTGGGPAIGSPTPKAIRRRSPPPSARHAMSQPITASAWPPRAKSAGPACTAGSG